MDELERLLKVCPFCGGEPLPPYQGADWWCIDCRCGAHGPSKAREAQAIAAWNRREPQDALLLEVGRLRDENEQLRLAICGGEDAPGYAASLPLETVLGVMRDHFASWKRDSELAWDGETAQSWKARAKAAQTALEFYRDNWDWFPGDGETPTPSDPGSPPTFYEAEPNAAMRADEGNRAREALLSPGERKEGASVADIAAAGPSACAAEDAQRKSEWRVECEAGELPQVRQTTERTWITWSPSVSAFGIDVPVNLLRAQAELIRAALNGQAPEGGTS